MKLLSITLLFCATFTLTAFGQVVKEVKIGNQVWMAENLNVEKFRNGDPIPQAKTLEQYRNSIENGKPMWCYYEFDSENGKLYGKMYNYFAIKDKRGLAPLGWKIPSKKDYDVLIKFLGGAKLAEKKLKATSGWLNSGNNQSGFAALPGGELSDNGFSGKGDAGFWWSSSITNDGIDAAFTLSLYGGTEASTDPIVMWHLMSVRCIKN